MPKATIYSEYQFEVAELQPDQDSPGLWIGFKCAADREQAMKLFRVALVAQGTEQGPSKSGVAGSSPAERASAGTTKQPPDVH